MRGASLFGLGLALAACRHAGQPMVRDEAHVGLGNKPGEAGLPGLAVVTIRLVFEEHVLHVTVDAVGRSASLARWKLGKDPVENLFVSSAGQRVAFRREGDFVDVVDARQAVSVAYDILGKESVPSATDVAFDEDPRTSVIDTKLRVVGERVLALPTAITNSVPMTVTIDARKVGAVVAASSFSAGRAKTTRRVVATPRALLQAAFVAGAGGHAEFDAPEGHDEAGWLGYTSFDPRAVSAEVAGFRGLLHDYFHVGSLPPATILFAVDPRPVGHFRVTRLTNGVFVTLSGADPYDAALRLAVAHELVHAWIGEKIWVGDASKGHEAETYWFHEGVARWVAREQLARAQLLSPDEYAAEVSRVLGVVVTSPHASKSLKDLVILAPSSREAVALLVARGTLFATREDAHVRKVSKGARSFDDVVRALASHAETVRGPLPATAVRDALAVEIGAENAAIDFDDTVAHGTKNRLPDDALGPCFDSRDVLLDLYAAGFDVGASRTAHALVGLDAKGPAAAAGLREADRLVTIDIPERSDRPASVTVERDQKRVVITYRPVAGTKRSQAFRRRANVSEEMCRKLALRR